MNRKFSCFVIGVPQIFKELDSVPRYKKGWEPLPYIDQEEDRSIKMKELEPVNPLVDARVEALVAYSIK